MRELRAEDAEQVAALFRDTFGDARTMGGDEVSRWLEHPEFEPGWLRVLELDGRVVGYGDIWPQSDAVALDVAAPGHEDAFLEWAETEARARRLPSVRVQIPDGAPIERVLGERGYEPWRFAFTMEIAFDERPVPPAVDGFELRTYRDGDDETVRAAINQAFALDPFFHEVSAATFPSEYFGAPGFDPALWVLAFDGDELAGFSLAYGQRFADTTLGWIGSLGVREPWRRRGLGEALLTSSFARLYDRGRRRVGLGVDAQNVTGALRLYERVGMRQVHRFANWRKQL